MRFIILALPRSRTAWLSVMLTAGRVRCLHDLAGENPTSSIRDILDEGGFPVSGVCDTAMALVFPNVLEALGPETRMAYVHRPIDECIVSFARATGLPIDQCERVLTHLHRLIMDHVLRVHAPIFQFRDLDKEETIRGIWNYITKGEEAFPETHYQQISKLHIQVTPSLLRDHSNVERHLANFDL